MQWVAWNYSGYSSVVSIPTQDIRAKRRNEKKRKNTTRSNQPRVNHSSSTILNDKSVPRQWPCVHTYGLKTMLWIKRVEKRRISAIGPSLDATRAIPIICRYRMVRRYFQYSCCWNFNVLTVNIFRKKKNDRVA